GLAAEVLLDAVEVLDRHEELVGLRVLQLQVYAEIAVGFEDAHAAEAGDAVVDVDGQLAGCEIQRELARQLRGTAARRSDRPRRSAQAAEQLGVRDEVEPDRWLHTAGGDVDVGLMQPRLELEVEVELHLPEPAADTAFVEKRLQALRLFGGEGDGGRRGQRPQLGDSAGAANERLGVSPADVDRALYPLTRRELQARVLAYGLHPLGGDDRERETARQLGALGFGRGQHPRLLDEHTRVGLLPAGLEIEHGHVVGEVIKQRRQRRFEVGGVELDTRKSTPRLQLFDLLI